MTGPPSVFSWAPLRYWNGGQRRDEGAWMLIVQTDGKTTFRIADAEPVFECGEGVRVSYHRTLVPPGEALPAGVERGVETVSVESPAGWLAYEETGGKHRFYMTGDPYAQDEETAP